MSLPERCSGGETGRMLGKRVWSQDPRGHRENEGARASRVPKHWERGNQLWSMSSGGGSHSVCCKPRTMAWWGSHSPCGGPAKVRTMATLLLPPGGLAWVWTAVACRVWCTQKCLLKVYWREGAMIFHLQGWRVGHCHFYFHPLKAWKPLGNKSHIEQPQTAYTEPGPLARGIAAPPRWRYPRISTAAPPPED